MWEERKKKEDRDLEHSGAPSILGTGPKKQCRGLLKIKQLSSGEAPKSKLHGNTASNKLKSGCSTFRDDGRSPNWRQKKPE